MTALSVVDLHKRFVRHLQGASERIVLSGAEFELEPGTLTVLRGRSGSGKSSLLRCIYRTYLPDSGSVLVADGEERLDLAVADDQTVRDARRRLIGMVTQFLQVTPRVAALDLVAEEGGDVDEAEALLLSLGLRPELLHAPPATFSGGERQLVNMALAIVRPRPLLLLDEATASLDPERRGRVLDALEAHKRRGTTMLAVFHDVPDTPGIVDRVIEMRDGRVVV